MTRHLLARDRGPPICSQATEIIWRALDKRGNGYLSPGGGPLQASAPEEATGIALSIAVFPERAWIVPRCPKKPGSMYWNGWAGRCAAPHDSTP